MTTLLPNFDEASTAFFYQGKLYDTEEFIEEVTEEIGEEISDELVEELNRPLAKV